MAKRSCKKRNKVFKYTLIDRKSKCLTTAHSKMNLECDYIESNKGIRRLTPTECARLQTIPKWYKWNCSDTQQYKMLGNGWTIEVIKHILSYLNF
jgi:DNA (cytosine-5)-methyltransferase 3A